MNTVKTLANPTCEWTADTLSSTELFKLLSLEPGDTLADVVPTHDGEWRYDGNGVYRWWQSPEDLVVSER